jgi:hypothetical protein
MEAASISETSVNFYQITRRNNLEDSHLHILNALRVRQLLQQKRDALIFRGVFCTFLKHILNIKYVNACETWSCHGFGDVAFVLVCGAIFIPEGGTSYLSETSVSIYEFPRRNNPE